MKLLAIITTAVQYANMPPLINKTVKALAFFLTSLYALLAVILLKNTIFNQMDIPDDYNNFKIAENLDEFFHYLSNHEIGPGSGVDATIPIQTALESLDYDIGNCGSDGIYGGYTINAVYKYQTDHNIKPTGFASGETVLSLMNSLKADQSAYDTTYEKLIKPFHDSAPTLLLADLDKVINTTNLSVIFRPDALTKAFYEALKNDARINAAQMLFKGCASLDLQDAFRHTDSMLRIAKLSGGWAAIKIGDMREKSEFNGYPLFLMDIYNHRAAITLLKNYEEAGLDTSNNLELFQNGMEEGRFILTPFPLVPLES